MTAAGRELHGAFANAILHQGGPPPEGLFAPPGASLLQRFSVYRANVVVGLVEALRSAFPVVNRLVGDDFFAAAARDYILTALPATPVLLAYGGSFPRFLSTFSPAADLPYLAEVARLEWLWLEAYHAREQRAAPAEQLAAIAADDAGTLHIALHPSTRYAKLAHSAVTIWRHHQRAQTLPEIKVDDVEECVLIVRPEAEVSVQDFTQAGCAFLDLIADARSIAEAAEVILAHDPQADVEGVLIQLARAGAFVLQPASGAPRADIS